MSRFNEGQQFTPPVENSPEGKEKNPEVDKVLRYLSLAQKEVNTLFGAVNIDVPEGERISVGPDMRLIPPPNIYTPEDKREIERLCVKYYGTSEEKVIDEELQEKESYQFEILKTAIMHKNMKSRYVVARSSRYDDITNGVDNVLMDKTTGDIVCALDEISPGGDITKNAGYQERRAQLRQKNLGDQAADPRKIKYRGFGAQLKYAPVLNHEEGTIECGQVSNIPIFLLSLDQERLRMFLKEFNEDYNTPSKGKEEALFSFLLTSIKFQIQELALDPHYSHLPSDLKLRIENFKKFIIENETKKIR
jgi:hypothetical protein